MTDGDDDFWSISRCHGTMYLSAERGREWRGKALKLGGQFNQLEANRTRIAAVRSVDIRKLREGMRRSKGMCDCEDARLSADGRGRERGNLERKVSVSLRLGGGVQSGGQTEGQYEAVVGTGTCSRECGGAAKGPKMRSDRHSPFADGDRRTEFRAGKSGAGVGPRTGVKLRSVLAAAGLLLREESRHVVKACGAPECRC